MPSRSRACTRTPPCTSSRTAATTRTSSCRTASTGCCASGWTRPRPGRSSRAFAAWRSGARNTGVRLPNSAHSSQPWRIHELTPDFDLEDVWALPTPGGPDDFPKLVQAMTSGDPSQGSSRAVRALWAIRWKLGELLGWDDPETGVGARVPTLRDRLPADLRDAPGDAHFESLPFSPVYLIDDEFAAEIANKTVHGVMHVGWVRDGAGGYRGQLAVLVKPNGLMGKAYLIAIKPARHLLVYPRMLKQLEREWKSAGYGRGANRRAASANNA